MKGPADRKNMIHPNISKDTKSGVYGHVDIVNEDGVFGWIVDLDSDELPTVELYVNGKKVAETKPTIVREDINKILGREVVSGFEFRWKKLNIEPDDRMQIEVYLNKKKKLKLTGNYAKQFYLGYIEGIINKHYIRGWICDKLQRNINRINITLKIDNSVLLEGIAYIYRKDLKKQGCYGFEVKIPLFLLDGKEHSVELVIGDYIVDKKNIKFELEKDYRNYVSIDFNVLAIKYDLNDKVCKPYNFKSFYNCINGLKIAPVIFFNDRKYDSLVYYELGKMYAIKRNISLAEGFYTLSINLDSWYSDIKKELLGNLYYENGILNYAKDIYNNIANTTSQITLFPFLVYCDILIKEDKDYKKAIDLLLNCINKYQNSICRKKLEDILREYFSHLMELLRNKIYKGDEIQQVLAWFWSEIKYIYNVLKKALSIDIEKKKSEIKKEFNKQKVLVVAGSMELPQCKRYRIEQKVQQLQKVGIKTEVISYTEIEKYSEKIYEYDYVIFYRHPVTFDILKFLAHLDSLNKISIFEIDDLVFDADNYPPDIDEFLCNINIHTYNGLKMGLILFNCMARLCKYGLVSTRPLQRKLQNLVTKRKVFVHRNAIDTKNIVIPVQEKIEMSKNKPDIILFYGSGTLSHKKDFLELLLPAIEKIFEEFDNVKLKLVGFSILPEEFIRKYKERLIIIPFKENIKEYYLLMKDVDINLVALKDSEFEGCKSELKWIEAACLGVPSVVSSTKNYRDVIKHEQDGFIAKDWKDFYKYIKRLILDENLRYKIAKNAQDRVLKEYSLKNMGKNLLNILKEIEEEEKGYANNQNISIRKKKIALVNVFFPPQLIGGGTVIAYENFKVLKQKYKDLFDISIFTSEANYYPDIEPYSITHYIYEDAIVYKVMPKFNKKNLEWEYYDEQMKEKFRKFLEIEKPDIVHFHAIQRLTASIVEACIELGIPYIITAHDAWWISDWMFLTDDQGNVYPEGFPDIYAPRPLPEGISLDDSIRRRLYLLEIANGASYFYTVSKEFAEIYKKNHIYNIEVIENGISEFINWENKDTSYTNRVVLGFTSAFSIHKGYDLLHKALEIVNPKNVELLLVDYAMPENSLKFGFIRNVPVRIIGGMERNRVVDFYKQIDILIHPSKWPESYGLAPREALMCGCYSVVSTRTGALKDFTNKEGAFIVEPDVEDLVRFLEKVEKNPEKFKKVIKGNKNLRKISQQVDELVENVYRKILY